MFGVVALILSSSSDIRLAYALPKPAIKIGMELATLDTRAEQHKNLWHNYPLLTLAELPPDVYAGVYQGFECSENDQTETSVYLTVFHKDILKLIIPCPNSEKEVFKWIFETAKTFKSGGVEGFYAMEWSGGAHCCNTYHVVHVKPSVRYAQRLRLGDSEGSMSACDDSTCLTYEDVRAYWRTSFADSIVSPVVLRLTAGLFVFDAKRTAALQVPPKKPFDGTAFQAAIRAAWAWNQEVGRVCDTTQSGPWNEPLLSLARHLTVLIYQSKATDAQRMLLTHWPADVPTSCLDNFRADLIRELRLSHVWPELLKTNGGTILGTDR